MRSIATLGCLAHKKNNLSNCTGRAPLCAWYQFTIDRKREQPISHLAGYKGWVHANGYPGFNGLFGENKTDEVACMAHVGRKFVDVFATQGSSIEQSGAENRASSRIIISLRNEENMAPPGLKDQI